MRKFFALMVSVLLLVSFAAGCNQENTAVSAPPSTAPSTAPASETPSGEPSETNEVTYPLVDSPKTFTCWWVMENNISTVLTSMSDNEYIKYMDKLTGIRLDFVHPSSGTPVEAFNLMIASQEYPDFVRDFSRYYSKGLDDAVENEFIYNLADYLDYLPNMNAARTSSKLYEVQSVTDSGYIAGIPAIMSNSQRYVNGLYVRQDWLDKLGLSHPETVDDLENILLEIKANYPSTANGPLWMNNLGACGMYESFNLPMLAYTQFMLIDGKPTYAILTDGFRDYITTLADWYSKGLIFKDFLSEAGGIPIMNNQAKVLNGEFGVTYECFVYTDIYNQLGKDVDPNFRLLPIKSPTQEPGGKVNTSGMAGMSKVTQGALAIMTTCEDIELACRYWDYGFTEEGSMRANFGEEGLTYTIDADGNPHYTDFALKGTNPDGLTFYLVQNKFMLQNAAYLRDGEREMYDLSDDTKLCDEAWTNNQDGEWLLPPVTLTAAEGTERANIMGDVNTYVNENLVRFIDGSKPISEFDAFIAQIKSMNVDRVCELYEAAIERYNSRGK